MTHDDKEKFLEVMVVLGAIFDKEISTTLLQAYFSALSCLTIDQVHEAGNHLARTSRFFPRPAEFLEIAQGSRDDQAIAAWALLTRALELVGAYRSLYVVDGAMAYAIRETWGGWLRCCEQLRDVEGPMLAHWQKQFVAHYRIGLRQEAAPQYFPGIAEAHNRQRAAGLNAQQWMLTADGEPYFPQQIGVIAAGQVEMVVGKFSSRTGQLLEGLDTLHPSRLQSKASYLKGLNPAL